MPRRKKDRPFYHDTNPENKRFFKRIWRSIIWLYYYILDNPWRSLGVFIIVAYLVICLYLSNFDWRVYANRNLYVTKLVLKGYYWLLTLRFTVQWFPNINPYIHPLYGLIWSTDLYLRQFENLLPSILGLDLSSMCAFACLEWLMQTVDAIKVAIDLY
uniref:hypothetical protein n=1 Tax=Phaeostrophion irregulare TaxID=243268 RepID=UPI002E7701A5|nr:hypothetical protein V2492_pgp019 [Phaeostrophion irregulare]WAM64367.1 hypothetical protein [Phaeostrophion irregulare]